MEVIEHLEGHYEAQEVPFGVVYRWCPECVVLECACGKRTTLSRSTLIDSHTAVCECGEDRTDEDQEVALVGQMIKTDGVYHPWRYAEDREGLHY